MKAPKTVTPTCGTSAFGLKRHFGTTSFMGAQGMSGAFDGMDSLSVFSLPIAVTLSGMLSTGGRTIIPSFEVTYVCSTGDTDAYDLRTLS